MNLRLLTGPGLVLAVLCGQAFCVEPVTSISKSGQFLVHGLPLAKPLLAPGANGATAFVRLDPTLLAFSCERIKAAVLVELAMNDRWKGKIYISLHPVRDDHEPIVVTTMHYADGWGYNMEIPEQVESARLIRSVVEVLLLELANRNARSAAAELPLWLPEGLSAQLQETLLANFILEPETHIAHKARKQDPLAHAREWLRVHPPLSLNELNWPGDEQLSGPNLETYQGCSQLFVSELLRLRDGRACLREMVALLADHLNWQTAFLRAFSSHFQRLIDVDKWWSLHVVHLVGQGFVSAWNRAEFSHQLEDVLATPVQVRLSSQEIPLNTQVRLQSILSEWDFARQQVVLRRKIDLLHAVHLRASEEFGILVDDYRQTLETYLQRRGKLGRSARNNSASPKAQPIVKETVQRLDDLDTRRDGLSRPAKASPAQISIAR